MVDLIGNDRDKSLKAEGKSSALGRMPSARRARPQSGTRRSITDQPIAEPTVAQTIAQEGIA